MTKHQKTAGMSTADNRTMAMFDLEIVMENLPGRLATMGEVLGRAGISIEGGGMFVVSHKSVGHFLFEDGPATQSVLEKEGFVVTACRRVLIQRLNQDEPGQLGRVSRAMAEAGVGIEALYGDHAGNLILLVDDEATGRRVSREWTAHSMETQPTSRA